MEKSCSANAKKRSFGNNSKKPFSHFTNGSFQKTQYHQLQPGMNPGGSYRYPAENGLTLCQFSNSRLAAQNAALREQLVLQHHRHDHERQQLLRALKKPNESKSENLIALVNEQWQQWWAIREQETADQFQTQWVGMQWYIEEMAVHCCTQLETMHEHNVDTVCYFQNEMEYLRWRMERVISERDDLIKNLKKENSFLLAENKELSSQLSKFKAETPEMQNTLKALEDQLQAEQEAKTSPAIEGPLEQVKTLEESFKILSVHEEELEVRHFS
ncbi:uncharacterized protein LOC109530281 [Hippocampus comes]|uniref:uncharacterized protein LOC109530281 n=1 Tax=Hippocampus comes TaxID=109280 RepID=UPI00094EC521|nr:PREDICTED: uncharacterized protein LOC109530281 [Hippocampus comes]